MMPKSKWVFLGDSLTYGYGVQRRQTWISLCQEQSNVEMVKAGVTGDTTGGMLARFRDDVVSRQATHVFVMGGANDIFLSGEIGAAKANLGAILYQSLSGGMIPVIGLPTPIHPMVAESPWGRLFNYTKAAEKMEELCCWLIQFTSAFGISVVDFRTVFGVPPDQRYYIDGLHASVLGQQKMAHHFLEAIFPGK